MALTSAPKILRGAFIEYGFNIPPLAVVFQFNPTELTRQRSTSFGPQTNRTSSAGGGNSSSGGCRNLRDFHERTEDLLEIQERQSAQVAAESISFDIRLDATDELAEGNPLAAGFGILPRLSTLELMTYPKSAGILGGAVDSLLGLDEDGFSFAKKDNPPVILFVWGHKRILPVNIESISIQETEFSPLLDPIRATATVNLKVIEGSNPLYFYSKLVKEASSLLNLANITDIANVVVPG